MKRILNSKEKFELDQKCAMLKPVLFLKIYISSNTFQSPKFTRGVAYIFRQQQSEEKVRVRVHP